MLISVVIPLVACNDSAEFPAITGRLVHGFWHHQWKKMDREIADRVHPNNDLAAFTLSPLMGLPQSSQNSSTCSIQVGQTTWFRVTTLDPDITELVTRQPDGWLAVLPKSVEIGTVTWKLLRQVDEAVAGWNLLSSYEELLSGARPTWRWTIQLETPTSFSGNLVDFTIPLPELLIKSWMMRWNRFAPPNREHLPEDLVDTARDHLRIVDYDLHTQLGERNTTGCLGTLTIQAYDLPDELRWKLDLLFHYAYFCGSGHRTAQGMGITRLLENA